MTKISLERIPRNMRIRFALKSIVSRIEDGHRVESENYSPSRLPRYRERFKRIFLYLERTRNAGNSNIDYSNFSFESTGKMFTYREKYFISGVPGFHFYFHSLLFGGGKQPMFRSFAFTYLSIFKGELVFFNGRTIVGYNVGDSRTIIKRDQSSWKLATKEK